MSRKRVALVLAGAALCAAAPSVGLRAYATYARWEISPIVYYVNPANLDVPEQAAEAAVQAGADVWRAQSGANVRLTFGGRVADTTTGYDNRNVVIFRNSSKDGAVASTYSWGSNGVLVDSDIIFWDGAYTFFTGSGGCSRGAYIEDIAAHEFGHLLGLSHSSVAEATMSPSTSWCSQALRTLDPDDIAGIRALYPPEISNSAPSVQIAAPASATSYVEGTVLSFSGSAADREDGDLSSRLVWKSNVDGTLGTGSSFSKALSVGSHIVTAQVSDSGGLSGSGQVSVTVTAAPNSAPSVSITTPSNNSSVVEATAIAFSGSASDPEDGDLSSRLVWTSSRDGQIGTGASFTRMLSVGTHTVVASVTDSRGLTASKQIGVTVTAIVNTAPSVTVSAPHADTSVAEGTSVTFSGSASDLEDGSLTAKIVWNSSLDGPLGIGGSLSRVLSVGTHTVTASVTDSGGLSSSGAVAVLVAGTTRQPAQPNLVLEARGYKLKGAQQADLTWSGAASGGVDIYRDGVLVTTTPNDGTHTDVVGRKGEGSATYVVCEAGTSTCSKSVPVRF